MPRRSASSVEKPTESIMESSETGLLSALRLLATDPDMPAMARTAAARAVLEAEGTLGRHARDPHAKASQQPLANASLAQLQAELVRLRQRFAAELGQGKQAASTA